MPYRFWAFLKIWRHVCDPLEVGSEGSVVKRVIPVPGCAALGERNTKKRTNQKNTSAGLAWTFNSPHSSWCGAMSCAHDGNGVDTIGVSKFSVTVWAAEPWSESVTGVLVAQSRTSLAAQFAPLFSNTKSHHRLGNTGSREPRCEPLCKVWTPQCWNVFWF